MLTNVGKLLLPISVACLSSCQSATHVYSAVPFAEDSILISAMAQPRPGSGNAFEPYIARCKIQPNQDLECTKMMVEWPDGEGQ